MLSLEEARQDGREIRERLQLKTYPVALKMLAELADIPDGAIRPRIDLGYELALCQGFALSRRQGKMVAMLKEDNWCYGPVIAFGLAEPPDDYWQGEYHYPSRTKTREAALTSVNSLVRLEVGSYIGILSVPLMTADFQSDFIMMYCNSAQLGRMLSSLKYVDGLDITSTLSPGGACFNAVVPVVLGNKCQVTIPCAGDRRLAMAQDDEMILTIPADRLADLIEGLRYLDKFGSLFPIKYEMRPEYPLSDNYLKLGRILGMNVHD